MILAAASSPESIVLSTGAMSDGFERDTGTTKPTANNAEPSIILLLTWTGAHKQHIEKYEKLHQSIFKTSPFVLIETSWLDMTFRSSRHKQRKIQSRVGDIRELMSKEGTSGAGILLHILSDGGSNKAGELAEVYLRTLGTKLPVSAMILDSTPGSPNYRRYCLALEGALNQCLQWQPLEKPLRRRINWRPLAKATAKVLLSLVWMHYHPIIGYENNPSTKARWMLEDERLFDHTIPRSFVCSREDKIVAFEDIKQHTEALSTHTAKIRIAEFSTPHVQHLTNNGPEYRKTIEDTWRRRLK